MCDFIGCTDEAACNFSPVATEDNGTCVYAEDFLDCGGVCLNDSDGDGVCDELEIVGCQDELTATTTNQPRTLTTLVSSLTMLARFVRATLWC